MNKWYRITCLIALAFFSKSVFSRMATPTAARTASAIISPFMSVLWDTSEASSTQSLTEASIRNQCPALEHLDARGRVRPF